MATKTRSARTTKRRSPARNRGRAVVLKQDPQQGPDTNLLQMLEAGYREPATRARGDWLKAYGEMPWLRGVVHRIAMSVAETPAHIYIPKGDQREHAPPDHPLERIIHNPNPRMSDWILLYLLQADLDLTGDGYWIIERNGLGQPGELWPLPSAWVVDLPKSNFPFFRIRFPALRMLPESLRRGVPVPMQDVIWFQFPNPADPYGWGLGTAPSLSDELESDEWAAKFNKKFFYNRARPDLIIGIEGITRDDAERMQHEWVSRYGGFWNAFKPAIMDASRMTIHQLTRTQKEMDFAELRTWSRDTVIGVFGVPPEVLGIIENSNRATVEAADFIFAKYTISPRLKLIQGTIQRELVGEFDKRLIYEFDNPVPEDKDFKLKMSNEGLQRTALKVNEWRQMNGLDPDPTGDVFLMPFNLVPMSSLGGAPAQQESVPPRDGGPSTIPKRDRRTISNGDVRRRGLSEQSKAAIAENIDKIARASERVWMRRLRTYFDGYHKRLLEGLRELAPKSVKGPDDLFDILIGWDDEGALLHATLNGLMAGTLNEAGRHMLQDVLEIDTDFNLQDSRVIQFLEEEGLEKAKEIVGTSKEAVREALIEGVRQGEGADALERRLRPMFEFDDKVRAELIARTETIAASNFGSLQGMRQSGVVERKEWWATLDDRLDEEICEPMHGEVVLLDADFDTPAGRMDGPPAHPRCRCVPLPVIE